MEIFLDIRQFSPGIRVDIYETKNIGLCVREKEREREGERERKGWAGFCGYIGTLRLSEKSISGYVKVRERKRIKLK